VKIGDAIMLDDEYLIAMECYEKYFEEKAFKLKTGQDSTPIHINVYVNAAKCAARLQVKTSFYLCLALLVRHVCMYVCMYVCMCANAFAQTILK
jgi:hypothetical protein